MTTATPQWISRLDQLPDEIVNADCWYLDTEFIRERTFHAELALVQIEAAGKIVLLDAPALEQPEALGKMLTDRTLVLHACSEDVEVLKHATGMKPNRIEDTQLAAALTSTNMQPSYQKLVEQHCQISLAKEATRSNWLLRPLSAKQLTYAADDVRYLGSIHHDLVAKLKSLGRYSWWQEECQRLYLHSNNDLPADQYWRLVKGVGLLNGQQRCRLVQLAGWRDRVARERNRPRSFIVSDKELIAICQLKPPITLDALTQQVHLSPKKLRRYGEGILNAIEQSEGTAIPAALPGKLDRVQTLRYRRWRAHANEIAESLQLHPSVLARRRWLEALARDPSDIPEPLSGWRYELLTRPLIESDPPPLSNESL